MTDADFLLRWLRASPGRRLISDSDGTVKAFDTAGFMRQGYTLDSLAASLREECDHKFVDSEACVKCGWTP